MDLKKIILSGLFCAVVALTSSAQKYKLPANHIDIADQQVEANLGIKSPFMAATMQAMREANPFADMNKVDAMSVETSSNPIASRMVSYAERFLGTRYVLGASGPSAFDCSGFTSYVYKNFGISLNRSSRSQYLQGERVAVNNLRPGDLLFFSSRSAGRGNVGHVAMVVSVDPASQTCRFIHASVKKGVTYQTFPDNGYYSRNFIGARRILGTDLDVTAAVDMAAN